MSDNHKKNIKLDAAKEIADFLQHKLHYGYYDDYAYGASPRCGKTVAMELEAERLRALNCEDERVTKIRETSNKISTILKTSKLTLKNTLDSPKEDFSQLVGELYSKAYYNIFNALKEAEPDTPDSTIRYFIDNFLNIEFKKEYDIKTMEYSFIVNATWKSPEEIASEVRRAVE